MLEDIQRQFALLYVFFPCVRTLRGCTGRIRNDSEHSFATFSVRLLAVLTSHGRSPLTKPPSRTVQDTNTYQVLYTTPHGSEFAKGCVSNRRHPHCAHRNGSNLTRPVAPFDSVAQFRLTVEYLFLLTLSRMYTRFICRLTTSKYRGGALLRLSTMLNGLPQPGHFIAISLEISGFTMDLTSGAGGSVSSTSGDLARFAFCGRYRIRRPQG